MGRKGKLFHRVNADNKHSSTDGIRESPLKNHLSKDRFRQEWSHMPNWGRESLTTNRRLAWSLSIYLKASYIYYRWENSSYTMEKLDNTEDCNVIGQGQMNCV